MDQVERSGVRIGHAEHAIVRWRLKESLLTTFTRFVQYSRNNIRAGLWKLWQRAILRRYLLLGIIFLVALAFGWRWLGVPLFCSLAILVARSIVAIWRNRKVYPAKPGRNLMRMLFLPVILAVLDAAALIGALQWLVKDRLGSDARLSGVKNGA